MTHDKATTVAAILAIAITAALFGKLPGAIPIHWGSSGKPDLWAPAFLVFLMPLGVLAANYSIMNERNVNMELRTKKARCVGGGILAALAAFIWWAITKATA